MIEHLKKFVISLGCRANSRFLAITEIKKVHQILIGREHVVRPRQPSGKLAELSRMIFLLKESIFTVFLLFLLSGCSNPPNNWPTSVPPSYDGNDLASTTYYLPASYDDWSDAGVSYNNKYQYKIKVFATSPIYSKAATAYRAIGNGTVSLCNYFGPTPKTVITQPPFPQINLPQVTVSSGMAFARTDNTTADCVSNSILFFNVPSPTRQDQTYNVDPTKQAFLNGMSLIFFKSQDFGPSIQCRYGPGFSKCCSNFQGYYSIFGCVAYNGSPLNESNAGAVEYIVSDTKPDKTAAGTPITAIVNDNGNNIRADLNVSSPKSGRIWLRVIDIDNNYSNNYGQYEVTIEYPRGNANFISIVSQYVIQPISNQVQQVSMIFWENLVGSSAIKKIIAAMITLYIVIYGIFFALGFVQATQKDLIARIFKISILYALIAPQSYQFFNDYLFKLFVDGQKYLIDVIINPESTGAGGLDYTQLFSFTNYAVNNVFSLKFLQFLGSCILWFPVGWLAFILLLTAFIKYALAIIEAIVSYLIAMTAVQFLIALGPIFIALLLFDRTKELFSKWLGMIVAFTMQPVILFSTIIFVSSLINGVIYDLMSIGLEWKCVIPLYIVLPAFGKIDLGCISWLNPIAPALSVLRDITIFYLLVALLKKVPDIATDIAIFIFGSAVAGVLGEAKGVAQGIVGTATEGAKGLVGMDKESIARRDKKAAIEKAARPPTK